MKLLNSDETKILIGGSEGYGGDNQLYDSPNIKFYEPSSLIVTQNTLIVADKSNRCIRKIDLQTKMVSTLSGGIIIHSKGENISPLQMYSAASLTFPFYYKNELYFVESQYYLRKVSNGKLKTVLGCQQETAPKYSANIPQRTFFEITNLFYIGNGDVLLYNFGQDFSLYNFNLETQNLTFILNSKNYPISQGLAAVGDSFENSTIYFRDFQNSILVLQKGGIVKKLQINLVPGVVGQFNVIPNLRYPNSNSLFLYSDVENMLYEYVDFQNETVSMKVFNWKMPSILTFEGFSRNDRNLFFWTVGQLYNFQLETLTLQKIGGLDYFNVSDSPQHVLGYNGENIPFESSAL